MILMQGKGMSQGVAFGPICFFRRPDAAVSDAPAAGFEAERDRIAAALAKTGEQLGALADRARETAGEETALLFETHAMFLEDEDYVGYMMSALEERRCTAERAAELAGEAFSSVLAAMEDPCMRARADDIRDVTRRILNNLTGAAGGGIDAGGPVVLAADDLSPSETLQLDRSLILGILIRGGSTGGHTAILARAMGIPAVCGLGEALKREYSGRTVYLDGGTGQAAVEPDGAVLASFRSRLERQGDQSRQLEALKGQRDVTLDGRELTVCCNIASPEEVRAVRDNDGQGIGLFRSEFLYLAAAGCPSEEEQFCAYRTVAAAMEGRRVVIRTLDIGADKQAEYFGLPKEANPALGERAIRLCFHRPELFRTQLRALYRASAYGRVAILFPMITSVWEVKECRRACRAVMDELDRERIPFRRDTELGIMIETPAAVLVAEELAREADFFSVGTNDLTQYMLACDRQSGSLDRFFDPRHPAVLRALKLAADAAHKAGIRVALCGRLAEDVSLLPVFLDAGIDELSVPPASVLPLRAAIRRSSARTCPPEKL